MKILFISWDSDQTNYLENLFFPIFKGLQDRMECQFYVLQFSWANPTEVERISILARQLTIVYQHHLVWRKPHPVIGSFLTTKRAVKVIKNLIEKFEITHVMPRSTMPAIMVNPLLTWLKKRDVKLIFDADGFPLQERIDYSGLNKNSFQYKYLKKAETKILKHSNIVLVRTFLSINIHLKTIGLRYRDKFFKVSNGRNEDFFKPDLVLREKIRKELSIPSSSMLWLYSGSVGPQYLLSEMLNLFENYHNQNKDSKFLFLVRDKSAVAQAIPDHLKSSIVIKSVDFSLIPGYYAAADLGVSLRKTASSLSGISPIKVGEYLLSGLPLLLSKGIGDLENTVGHEDFCFMHPVLDEEKFYNWLAELKHISKVSIREKAMACFALENSLKEYETAILASNSIVD